jgi:uncharacterized membrane protein
VSIFLPQAGLPLPVDLPLIGSPEERSTIARIQAKRLAEADRYDAALKREHAYAASPTEANMADYVLHVAEYVRRRKPHHWDLPALISDVLLEAWP